MRWFTLLLIGCVSVQAAGAVINVPADFFTIQAAIDAASPGDVVIVAPGTYPESINFIGKEITVRSTDPNDPVVVQNTIIDGTGFLHVVQCVSGEGPGTVLSGFVITGGNANVAGDGANGGGMFNDASSPMVTDCIFSGNSAFFGGGMSNINVSNPVVIDCTFSGNSAGSEGGGMYNNASSPTVTDCTFNGNSAPGGFGLAVGGGMRNIWGSDPTVIDCTFSGNMASRGGGMDNIIDCNPEVTGCTFSGNSALSLTGGGMYNNQNSFPTVTDCTFSGNTAATSGGGMFSFAGSSPTVTDCAFCGNTPEHIDGEVVLSGQIQMSNFCPIPVCPADISGDTQVNVTDLLQLLAAWGACP